MRALQFLGRQQQRLALVGIAERVVLPPLGQFCFDLAGIGTQAQEIVAGAVARLLDQ